MTPSSSSPTVLHCTSPAQFLASIPLMLGYEPSDSIVVTLFEGARAHSAARFDIPPRHSPLESTQIDDAVVKLVRQVPDVESIAIVVYTTDAFTSMPGVPHALLAMWLERAVELAGIPVRELACVAADGWALYRVAPGQAPRPLSEISEHRSSLQSLVPDHPNPESLEAMSTLPEADPGVCAAIEHHLALHDPVDLTQCDALAFTQLATRCWTLLAKGLTTETADVAATVILLTRTMQTWLIPVILISADTGSEQPRLREETAEAFLTLLHNPVFTPPSGGEPIARRLLMFSSERLNLQRLRKTVDVLLKLSAHAPIRHRTGVLTLAAWAWWMGAMGTPASVLYEEARSLDPTHPTVRTLETLMEQGTPLWVFSRRQEY